MYDLDVGRQVKPALMFVARPLSGLLWSCLVGLLLLGHAGLFSETARAQFINTKVNQRYFVFIEGGLGSSNPGRLELPSGRTFSKLNGQQTVFSAGIGARFGEQFNLSADFYYQSSIQAAGFFSHVILYHRRINSLGRPYLFAGFGGLRSASEKREDPSLRGFAYSVGVGIATPVSQEIALVIGGRGIFGNLERENPSEGQVRRQAIHIFLLTARIHLDLL